MKPHKHAAVIKAWAENQDLTIQLKTRSGAWIDCDEDGPSWDPSLEYRIKPAAPVVEYPVTKMGLSELDWAWASGKGGAYGAMVALANAAIRHAIDAQQVVRMAEVQEIASELNKSMRAARELAVAEAVHQAHVQGRYSIPGAWDLDLPKIIASVK